MRGVKNFLISILAAVYKWGLKHFSGMGLQSVWPLGVVRTWMNAKLRAHNWPESSIILGHVFYAPPGLRLSAALFSGEREELEFRLFEREIPKGGTAVDVGANTGYYSLPLARAVGAGGKVFAFEPEPANLAFLRKNIEANGYKNVTVIPKAVGDHSGTVSLFISDHNVGGHQIWDMRGRINSHSKITEDEKATLADEHQNTPRRKVEVGIVSLDEFFKDYKEPIHFVKIDVEGAEGGVMHGMKEILKKNKDLKLHFEFTPAMMRLFGTDPNGFLMTLEGFGFKFYSLTNYKKRIDKLERLDIEKILTKCSGNKSDEIFAKRD